MNLAVYATPYSRPARGRRTVSDDKTNNEVEEEIFKNDVNNFNACKYKHADVFHENSQSEFKGSL